MSQAPPVGVRPALPAFDVPAAVGDLAPANVAVIGLGYVGLPTALALHAVGTAVIGVDVSERRLRAIRDEEVDLSAPDIARLRAAVAADGLRLTTMPAAIAAADAVVICVPTPVDAEHRPDPRALHAACNSAVEHARAGQTIILTSTTYVGSTRELLVEPLRTRGLDAGTDIFVAFAPERILPGDPAVEQRAVPRVLGGATPACSAHARQLLGATASNIHEVSSLEAAELTKLVENTFRAVNLAFANEMAGVSTRLGLDPVEVVDAAATKPYGFLAHYPGAGVGGHCIPVDPHYLLAPLRATGVSAPIVEEAMTAIERRPRAVAARALAILRDQGIEPDTASVLIAGMAYKPGVADVRGSPGLAIGEELERAGVERLAFHDPRVKTVRLASGRTLRAVLRPESETFDLVVITTLHDDADRTWLTACEHVLDATYRVALGRHRHLV